MDIHLFLSERFKPILNLPIFKLFRIVYDDKTSSWKIVTGKDLEIGNELEEFCSLLLLLVNDIFIIAYNPELTHYASMNLLWIKLSIPAFDSYTVLQNWVANEELNLSNHL